MGQIDKESLVRKQSLHMLKTAVRVNRVSRSSCISEAKSRRKRTTPSGMTKREAWANIEAKSLGVGRICDTIESTVNSDKKWEAFVLLYEMLEEYGTHLVEAAWNHQVCLFYCFYLCLFFFFMYAYLTVETPKHIIWLEFQSLHDHNFKKKKKNLAKDRRYEICISLCFPFGKACSTLSFCFRYPCCLNLLAPMLVFQMLAE